MTMGLMFPSVHGSYDLGCLTPTGATISFGTHDEQKQHSLEAVALLIFACPAARTLSHMHQARYERVGEVHNARRKGFPPLPPRSPKALTHQTCIKSGVPPSCSPCTTPYTGPTNLELLQRGALAAGLGGARRHRHSQKRQHLDCSADLRCRWSEVWGEKRWRLADCAEQFHEFETPVIHYLRR
jgi:hypothetical protein